MSLTAFSLQTKPSGRIFNKAIYEKLVQNVLEKSRFYDISEQSGLLPKLNVDAEPELERMEVFAVKTTAEDISYKLSKKEKRERENRPETPQKKNTDGSLFQRKEVYDGKTVLDTSAIFENFDDGVLAFVGPAGSGKTTLLKSITRNILAKKYECFKDLCAIHFIDMRSCESNETLTTANLLFRNVTPQMSDTEMKEAMEFAEENPSKVLFVIDSLENLSFTIDGVYSGMSLNDQASPEVILAHLLSGELLPGCRFITGSRLEAIINFKGLLRPKTVVALKGLSKQSRKEVVVGYLGEEEANEVLDYIESKPDLDSLSMNPFWLVLTLMVLKSRTKLTPSTRGGILSAIFDIIMRSPHAHGKDMEEVMEKVMNLSYVATTEHRFLLSAQELLLHDLTVKEVSDVLVTTRGGLSFPHDVIRDFLATLFVAKMDIEKFKEFSYKDVHTPHYYDIRGLLYTIILNDEGFEASSSFLAGGADFEEKRAILKRSLELQLQWSLSKRARLDLYSSLTEVGDGVLDIIQNKVLEMDFGGLALSPSDTHAIGWVAGQQQIVRKLDLCDCCLSVTTLSALQHGLAGSNVKIETMLVDILSPECMAIVGEIAKQCHVDKILFRDTVNAPLHAKLVIYWGNEEAKNEIEVLEIHMALTCFADAHVQHLFQPIKSVKACKEIRAVLNPSIGCDGLEAIGQLAKETNADTLRLYKQKFLAEEMKAMKDAMDGLKLKELDLCSDQAQAPEMSVIGSMVDETRPMMLKIPNSKLRFEGLQAFLDSCHHAKVSMFEMREYVDGIVDGKSVLGETIKSCGIENLHILPVDLDSVDPVAFGESLSGNQLDTLDLKKWSDEEMSRFNFPEENKFSDHANHICRFFPFVRKTIDLKGWILRPSDVAKFQSELDTEKNKGLRIIYGKLSSIQTLCCKGPTESESPYTVDGLSLERKNGCIAVSWRAPPEGLVVVYHVQEYCDGVRTGDVHAVSEPYYEVKEPQDSKLYSFDVWACTPEGIEAEVTTSHQIPSCPGKVRDVRMESVNSTDRIISKPFCKEINPEGGEILLPGCKVLFRPGTFGSATRIRGKLEIGGVPCPEGYFTISPVLHVDIEQNLPISAKVEMETWCTNNPPQTGNKLCAHVLHYDKSTSVWRVIKEHSLDGGTTVTFESCSFSPIVVGIWESLFGNALVNIDGGVYASPLHKFNLIFYPHHPLTKERVDCDMRDTNSLLLMKFSTLTPRVDEKLQATIDCFGKSGIYSFGEDNVFNFTVDKRFQLKQKHFLLQYDGDKSSEVLSLQSGIKRDGETIDGPHRFPYIWKKTSVETDQHEALCNWCLRPQEMAMNQSYTGAGVLPSDQKAGYDWWDAVQISFIELSVKLLRDRRGHIPRPANTVLEGTPVDPVNEVSAKLQPEKECPREIEPKLVLENTSLHVSWTRLEEKVLYCINLYCDGQLVNDKPYQTPVTMRRFRGIQPSLDYFCEVWAKNSHGVEGSKSWSNVITTDQTARASGRGPDLTSDILDIQVTSTARSLYQARLHSAEVYYIDAARAKGKVLIINNMFVGKRGERLGSDIDVSRMKRLWTALGLNVTTEINLSALEMLNCCRNFAQNANNVNVVVVIIMSHGGQNEVGKEVICGEDDATILLDDLVDLFNSRNSPHLQGIPKVFIFQACRGRGLEFQTEQSHREDVGDAHSESPWRHNPQRADMLLTFPTQAGYEALRNTVEGSWLMNAVANVFMQRAHNKHVLDMLTMVNRAVANKVSADGRIQISIQQSYLTKELHLFPGWPLSQSGESQQ